MLAGVNVKEGAVGGEDQFVDRAAGVRDAGEADGDGDGVRAVGAGRHRGAGDAAADALADGTLALDSLASADRPCTIAGRWLEAPWDLLAQLSAQLADDIPAVASTVRTASLMYDALGSSTLTVEEGAIIQEKVGLKFSKIKWKYTQQKVTGGAGGNTSGGWDLATNKIV